VFLRAKHSVGVRNIVGRCAEKSQNIIEIFENSSDICTNSIDISTNFNDILSFFCAVVEFVPRWRRVCAAVQLNVQRGMEVGKGCRKCFLGKNG